MALKTVHGSATAGHARRLTVTLPRTLLRAIRHRAKTTLRLTLRATGSGGTARASVKSRRLRLR